MLCVHVVCMLSVDPAGLITLHCCWSKAANRGYQEVGGAQKTFLTTKRAVTHRHQRSL